MYVACALIVKGTVSVQVTVEAEDVHEGDEAVKFTKPLPTCFGPLVTVATSDCVDDETKARRRAEEAAWGTAIRSERAVPPPVGGPLTGFRTGAAGAPAPPPPHPARSRTQNIAGARTSSRLIERFFDGLPPRLYAPATDTAFSAQAKESLLATFTRCLCSVTSRTGNTKVCSPQSSVPRSR
jgi:hypothetical protein